MTCDWLAVPNTPADASSFLFVFDLQPTCNLWAMAALWFLSSSGCTCHRLDSLICSIDYLLARQWNFSHLIPGTPNCPWVAEWFLAIVKTGDRQFMTEKPRPIAVNPELSRGEFCRFPLILPVLFFPQKLPLPALPCLAPPANQQTIWNLGKKTHWSTISGWFRNDGSLEWLIKDLAPSDIENISLKFAILAILPQILVYGKICISSPLCLGDLLLQSITSAHTNCFGAFLWYVSGIHHFVLF